MEVTGNYLLSALTLLLALLASDSALADDYDDFNQFAKTHFGAEIEPLAYEKYGSNLSFIENSESSWNRASRNSFAVGFETNLPAVTSVEFGTTTSYGSVTPESDRFYSVHLHHLKNLQLNTTYHYRLVARDERGNILRSNDRTFTTSVPAGVRLVPGSMQGPPYILNQSGTYVLTQDISSDTRGITITAADVVLDLNGYTITYDQGQPLVIGAWNDYEYSDISTFGVVINGERARILNGTIRQGLHKSAGNISIGFNPILGSDNNCEIAGIVAEYSGTDVGGIITRYDDNDIHHNVVIDRGTVINDRHQGLKAIWTDSNTKPVHHNLIKRARHQGIISNGNVRKNEIYVDSWDTNSFAVKPASNSLIEENRIYGTGYHMVGVSWDTDVTVRANYLHLHGAGPNDRSDESGTHCSVNGFRLTQYGGSTVNYNNNLYENNYIAVITEKGCQFGRGMQLASDPYVRNMLVRNNVVKAISLDNQTTEVAPVVLHGLSDRKDQALPVIYEGNRFYGNVHLVIHGDNYTAGSNHVFRGNRFIRVGNHPAFHTHLVGYWIYQVTNHFYNSTEENGALLDDASFRGTTLQEYFVGHTLHVIAVDSARQAIAGKVISVEDNSGVTSTATTDNTGYAEISLVNYRMFSTGAETGQKQQRTGHTLKITGYPNKVLSPAEFALQNTANSTYTVCFTPTGVCPNAIVPNPPSNLRVTQP